MFRVQLGFVSALAFFLGTPAALGQSTQLPDYVLGIRISVGGRFDNVRKCVATSAGTRGGPAMDVSFFTEFRVRDATALTVNVPVLRPILFATAFQMLQFEPEMGLSFRPEQGNSADLVVGPTLGLTLHYGPDYRSEKSGPKRGRSFFAMGPTFGVYLGADFKRPEEKFNFQLGAHPYVTPLFAIRDPERHRGVVVGGLLEGQLRFVAR